MLLHISPVRLPVRCPPSPGAASPVQSRRARFAAGRTDRTRRLFVALFTRGRPEEEPSSRDLPVGAHRPTGRPAVERVFAFGRLQTSRSVDQSMARRLATDGRDQQCPTPAGRPVGWGQSHKQTSIAVHPASRTVFFLGESRRLLVRCRNAGSVI